MKRSIEQEIRNKNFGARSGNFEKNAVVKNQGTKQRVQRILGDCWQWETNGQCVKGNNCSFRHDMNKRGKSSPSNPSPNSFMRQNERKPSRTRSPRGTSHQGMTTTGGDGLARLPNLRVCKHLWSWGGTRRGRRMNQHPAVVPSSRRGNTSSESRRRENRAAQKG